MICQPVKSTTAHVINLIFIEVAFNILLAEKGFELYVVAACELLARFLVQRLRGKNVNL